MNRYILIAITTTLILLCNCKSNTDEHAPSTDTVKSEMLIAYNVLVDPASNNYDIFITDFAGNNQRNITENDAMDWVYSSYEDRLYVISDRDTCNACYFLYETDAQGSHWTKISETQIQDSWVDTRNKGEQIIIKPIGQPNTPFQIIDKKGNVITEIDPQMDYFNDPCFAPDGNSIVYRGYNGALSKSIEAELYLYDINAKTNTQLTTYPKDAQPIGNYQYRASPPRWNDKSNMISYSSSFDDQSVIKSATHLGEAMRNLTQKNVKAMWHDISADGEWLTFDGQLDFKADSTTTQIFLMNFDKRSSSSITSGAGYKLGPVFVKGVK